MITFVLILVFLGGIILSFQYFAVLRMYYTCKATSHFKELKHDIVLHVTDDLLAGKKMSKDHLIRYRGVLNILTDTVEHFQRIPAISHESIKPIINNIVLSTRKIDVIEAVEKTESDNLSKFAHKYAKGIFLALQAIPYFKFSIVIGIFRAVFTILIKLGAEKFGNYKKRLRDLSNAEDKLYHHCPMP